MFGFRMFKLLNLFVLGFYFVNVQSGKELPIDLKCYIRSHNLTQCFWNPTTAPDSRFFYKFVSQDVDSPAPPPHVQECSSYMSINNLSTSCDLQRHYKHAIYINFTQNETVLKTFRILALADGLSPPPLKWTFTVSGNIAKIKWTAPDFGVDKNLFTFTLNYTHCGESKEVSQLTGQTYELKLDSRCQYCVVIKPVVRFYLKGETSWSDKKCFGTNITVDPPMYGESNPMAYVILIFIPLVCTILAALMILCLWKNKDKVFPKIPEPRDYFTDVLNNNKVTVADWSVPMEEEENCKISLVTDHKVDL